MVLTSSGGNKSFARFTAPLKKVMEAESCPFLAIKVVVIRLRFASLISSAGRPLV